MDPLAPPLTDVSEHIFQHLDARDVLNCSLVSKSWYEAVGASRCCMKQILVRVDRPWTQVELLKHSRRKYENFRIQPGRRAELSEILRNCRPKWVTITDEIDEQIEFCDYYEFMRSMAPTVEVLQPGEADVLDTRKLLTINFPKLKELQLTVTNRNAFSIFLGSNPKLEKVLLSLPSEITSEFLIPTNIVQQFLLRNQQIKDLMMCEVDCAFQADLTENSRLDLKNFAFSKTSPRNSIKVADNLVKFIKGQKHLESLKILCLNDQSIFLEIWSGGSFRKLFIMDCSLKGRMTDGELPRNDLITEINFYLNPSCHVLKFLRACPNLTFFKVRQLSRQILEFSATNLPRLEKIQFQSIEIGVVRFYDELIARGGVNNKIKLEEMNFFEFVGHDGF